MSLSECSESSQMDRDSITRSDRSPSKYERYSNWASKFFGYGCHQRFKDAQATLDYVSGLTRMTPTRH